MSPPRSRWDSARSPRSCRSASARGCPRGRAPRGRRRRRRTASVRAGSPEPVPGSSITPSVPTSGTAKTAANPANKANAVGAGTPWSPRTNRASATIEQNVVSGSAAPAVTRIQPIGLARSPCGRSPHRRARSVETSRTSRQAARSTNRVRCARRATPTRRPKRPDREHAVHQPAHETLHVAIIRGCVPSRQARRSHRPSWMPNRRRRPHPSSRCPYAARRSRTPPCRR